MKRFLPLFVVLGGFAAAALLIATGPQVQPQAAKLVPPLVRTLTVQPGTHQFNVRTHGSVVPRTESELVPEVDGRVLRVSPALVSGGFFSKNDVLLEIDSLDYDVALEQARAGIARAESDLDNERKDHERQEDLVTKGSISASQLDNSLNRVTIAKATLREARARLARAERDLARTSITAPYDGRVRSERVDAGQFVRRGEAIGTIYAVDFAEVRLPIHANELAYLDLPISKAGQALATQSKVTLSAEFAGSLHSWQGKVVRTEGELDPMTRMVHVVAQIANPYDSRQQRAPLAVGLFVDATIHGKTISNATVLPRSALRRGNQVFVVDEQDRLRFRTVNVLRLVDDQVYIGEGLSVGERVCVSALQSTADGMLVRVVKDATSS
ncbi:MAG: efflux RND transporter periplasmic adaptor subunit [Halioglobus sp.]|nr:efflux RND transporter periplasmic adaptor subunit [Halioglobus sp.]